VLRGDHDAHHRAAVLIDHPPGDRAAAVEGQRDRRGARQRDVDRRGGERADRQRRRVRAMGSRRQALDDERPAPSLRVVRRPADHRHLGVGDGRPSRTTTPRSDGRAPPPARGGGAAPLTSIVAGATTSQPRTRGTCPAARARGSA
jgi:hypothetical protein